jgi:hypothetical protein
MVDMITQVKTINSAVRTALLVGITGVVGYGGWVGYDHYVRPGFDAKQAMADREELRLEVQRQAEIMKQQAAEISSVKLENVELHRLKERLETSLKLLKIDQRVAHLKVLEKGTNEEGQPFMEVRFFEVNERGETLGSPRDFTILGEKIYVDGWVVSFEDQYIEQADELRSASLFVFHSIFGELERPAEAKRLDTQSENALPGIYKSEQQNEFEEKIWSDFWKVSNSRQLQRELGIRASHGQANYMLGEKGQTYQVEIRASGSMSIKPLDE